MDELLSCSVVFCCLSAVWPDIVAPRTPLLKVATGNINPAGAVRGLNYLWKAVWYSAAVGKLMVGNVVNRKS